MADHPRGGRRYSDREMSALLQRALERQDRMGSLGAAGPGVEAEFSLEEIEQIAAEVGIDPEHVRAVAAEYEVEGASGRGFSWLGPARLERARVVAGEISEEVWEAMVAEMRRSLVMGEQAQVGRSLEFTYNGASHKTQVTVTPCEQESRIEVRSQWSGARLTFYLPILYLAVLSTLIFIDTSSAPVVVKTLFGLASLSGAFALARASFGAWARNHQQRLLTLMDRLSALVPEPTPTEEQPGVGRRLSAEEADEDTVTRRRGG